MSTGKRQLAAIMFTDVVGYTAMMSKDEKKALAILEKVRETLKPLISQYHGKWLKEMGDGSLSSFHSASDAVICALAFQRALISETDFKIRIGIHVGEVVFTEDDVYGDGVNIASRIEPLAPPGGIYISGRVYEDIHNKPEMEAVFVGDRKLKNLNNPIKVYTLVGEGLPEPPDQSFTHGFKARLQNLWERRLPQIVGVYMLVSYFIVQIIEWLLYQYNLSPYWAEISGVFLISSLPSVGVIAYFHGRSGPDKWVQAEKITIPVNVVFSVVLLFFAFQGKDLGATVRAVSLLDEEGKSIERMVPKSQFRKSIGFFYFKNNSENPSLNWLAPAIPLALQHDISQDPYIDARESLELVEEITRNKADINKLPVALMRKIARVYRLEYFMFGNYTKEADNYAIQSRLFETNKGKLVAEREVTGKDIFDLGDQLVQLLKEDLGFSASHIDEAKDLALATILTDSESAFQAYTEGIEIVFLENKYEEGIKLVEKAVEIDPHFAMAYLQLMALNVKSSQFEAGKQYIAKAMEHLYMLPERLQLITKSINYYLNEEKEKRIKILQMWQELYPDDLDPYLQLGMIYLYSGESDKAEQTFQKALEIGDGRGNVFVRLAEINMTQQEYDEALSYYKLYAEKYPDHARSFKLLGDFHFDQGKYDRATENYEKATFLDDGDSESLGQLALIKERLGNYQEALSDYLAVLSSRHSVTDSVLILRYIRDYHFNRGTINKGLEFHEFRYQLAARIWTPVKLLIHKTTRSSWYLEVGKSQEALDILHEVENQFSGPYGALTSYGYITYYLYHGQLDKARQQLEIMKGFAEKYGSAGNIDVFYTAELAYWEGNYKEAVENYQIFQKGNLFIDNAMIENRVARAMFKLGEWSQAARVLVELLKVYPNDPEAHYRLALIYEEKGDTEEALKHLEITNRVWENADPEYQIAADAKNKLAELTKS